MKLNVIGLLFELEKINFRVGSVMQISFHLDGMEQPFVERVRSIKHYDRFFRTPPSKLKKGEPPPQPKKLIEAHFVNLREDNRKALLKFLMSLSIEELKKRR